MTPGRTLFDVLAAAAECFGDAEFLVIGRRAQSIGFAELSRCAEGFGKAIWTLGVRPGDRVALAMTNQVDWAIAAYGIARCGAVLVGVNTRLSSREVGHMIQLTRPRVWLMKATRLGKIRATDHIAPVLAELAARGVTPPAIVVRSDTPPDGTIGWDAMLRAAETVALAPAAELVARAGAGDFPELAGVAAILSTSGTTAALRIQKAKLREMAQAAMSSQETGAA